MKKFRRDESGQVLALIAMGLVVLLGFAALAVDVGLMMHKRAQLQKAADAAALAGVRDIWTDESTHEIGKNRAIEYANANGASVTVPEILNSYDGFTTDPGVQGSPIFLRVKCEGTVNFFFAPIIGKQSAKISAEAVAVKIGKYGGDTLPFINYGENPEVIKSQLTVWNMEGPGDKESLLKDEIEYVTAPIPHYKVYYNDEDGGIALGKGKQANIKQELIDMFQRYGGGNQRVRLLSLKPEIFEGAKFNIINHKGHPQTVTMAEWDTFSKNKFIILKEGLVMLECEWNEFYHKKNELTLGLTVKRILTLKEAEESEYYDSVGDTRSYLVK